MVTSFIKTEKLALLKLIQQEGLMLSIQLIKDTLGLTRTQQEGAYHFGMRVDSVA